MSDEEESGYYGLSNDFDQLIHGYDGAEKAKGGLKLLGKSIFNIGKFAFTEVLPSVAERSAKEIIRSSDDPEKRERAKAYLEKHK